MNTQRLFELRSSAHNESSEQVHLPNLYQGNVIPSVDPRNKEHQSFYFSHPSVSTYFSSSLCSCYWPWKMKELWSLTASMNAHSWISLCTQIQVRLGTYVASWYCYTILPIPSLPVWLGTGFKYIYFFFQYNWKRTSAYHQNCKSGKFSPCKCLYSGKAYCFYFIWIGATTNSHQGYKRSAQWTCSIGPHMCQTWTLQLELSTHPWESLVKVMLTILCYRHY